MSSIATGLHPDIKIIFSTVSDGSMSSGGGVPPNAKHVANVGKFLARHGFPDERTRVYVTYGDEASYTEVDRVTADTAGGNVICDALYTTEPGQVITLPVADCVATVVYDPVTCMLGVLHLGRHSSISGLIEAFAIEVADVLGSDPRDWYVWMSPSIRQQHDRLDYFRPPVIENWREHMSVGEDGKIHIDTIGHNTARFVRAGVEPSRIVVSPHDTYDDTRLYSQRAYTETGDASRLGRMMVAVRIVRPSAILKT